MSSLTNINSYTPNPARMAQGEHRYTLASNKAPKLNCPYCGAKKHWQRYIDIETGEILPEQHGRCDNEDKCGKWVTPKDTGYAKQIWEKENGITESTKITVPKQKYFGTRSILKPKPVYFDFETFKRTLGNYEKNTFVQNLMANVRFPFETTDVEKAISLYRLGTVSKGYRTGAVTFPFIDQKGNVRTIQVKQFDKANHTTGTDFLHSIIEKHHDRNNKPLPQWLQAYLKQEGKVSCLFGAHLLDKYPQNPVALVEAPKTAVYGTLYFGFPDRPDNLVWLSVFNIDGFTSQNAFDRIKALRGRDVFVFPDLSKDGGTYRKWETKAKEYENRLPGTRFVFSDLLERLATAEQKEDGADIADVLIKQDWRDFRAYKNVHLEPQPDKNVHLENQTFTNTGNPVIKNDNRPDLHTQNSAYVKPNNLNTQNSAYLKTPPKLHWRHYLKIPLETRQAVVMARQGGNKRPELKKMFPQLKPREINLILDPDGGGVYSQTPN